MESEDIVSLKWDIQDAIKKWHKERPADRTYGSSAIDREQAINRLVRHIIYGPPKPGRKTRG